MPAPGEGIAPMATPAEGPPPAGGPLAGLRVLELATLNAGPTLGAMLGDLGADVVKVEPRAGEDFRILGAPAGPTPRPSMWTVVGRNKRMVTLDHDQPEGRDILGRLTAV